MRKTLGIILFLFCLTALGQAACAESIGQAKSLPLGAPVVVNGVVSWLRGFECYIQEQDRSAGIWVQGNTIGIGMGEIVTAVGTLGMDGYELVIAEANIYPTGQASGILPFAMSNKAVGGAYAFQQFRVQDRVAYKIPDDGIGYRWDFAGGASNVGMLVKTSGTVKSTYYSVTSDQSWFYIDDGSGVTSDFGDSGILVYSSADVKQGDYVSVTGVSSVELAFDQPDKLIRVIRPRWYADVEVLKPYERKLGFSDEFDGTEIDPRWTVVPGLADWSVESGHLVMVPHGYTAVKMLAQMLPENYDLDMKVDMDFSDDPAYTLQELRMELGMFPVSQGDESQRREMVFYAVDHRYIGRIIYKDYPDNQNFVPLQSDTFWLRMSCREGNATAWISYDGTNYSDGYPITGLPVFVLYASVVIDGSVQSADIYRACIDYISITPVNE